MQIIEKKLGEIRAYENNPRNNDDAVHAVAESIREFGATIFGGGLLLSEKAAAEKAAAEKAAAKCWQLSEREREIVRSLSGGR